MSPPTFSVSLEPDLVQKVGTKLVLQVQVESDSKGGKVFFEWRGPTNTLDESRVCITENGNTSMTSITPLTLQDQGVWVCSAKNKHGISQTKCNIIAQVPKSYKPPVFLEELTTSVSESGTVSLECKVVGIPSPTLRWFRDGEEIKSGDMFALQARLDKPVSVYKCEATNCMGSASSSSVLDISQSLSVKATGPPVFSDTLIDRKVKIGEVVELTAAVTELSLPVKINWWNHGSKIQFGDKYNLVEKGEGRFSVIINPVELTDDGEWKITAENQFGTTQSQCILTLRVPKNYRVPKFVEDLKAVLTKEGLVSFECKVVGFPTPVLRWFKDGAELKPGDVYQLSGSKSLGTYSCLARNCMGEAVSTASLTVEDIGEKFPDSRTQLRFLVPLQDAEVVIGANQRLSVQVTYSPCLELSWFHGSAKVVAGERIHLCKEDGGYFHCDLMQAAPEDQGEWSVLATDAGNELKSVCNLTVSIPKHYKKPNFLEPLKAVLTDEGAVNLECKVIGVPQPTLSWYKDGAELKAGDIHRLMSGSDGSCCLGTYTCVATNAMGRVTSSAALLGYDDAESAGVPEIQSPDLSGGTVKPFSLSTIQEERTSQLMSPEAHEQILSNNDEDPPSISFGKVDEAGDMSISLGNQEVTLSMYQTPDLSEKDTRNICEMFAEELAESVNESKYVELPPLRFMKDTAKASNVNMEAIIIDVDEAALEEYESMKKVMEGVDELKTEADIEDVSEWNDEVPNIMEYEALTCEEVFEYDQDAGTNANILTESETLQCLSKKDVNKQKICSPPPDSLKENSSSEVLSQSKSPKSKGKKKTLKAVSKPVAHTNEASNIEANKDKQMVEEEVMYEEIQFIKQDEKLVSQTIEYSQLKISKEDSGLITNQEVVNYTTLQNKNTAETESSQVNVIEEHGMPDTIILSPESEVHLDEEERLAKDKFAQDKKSDDIPKEMTKKPNTSKKSQSSKEVKGKSSDLQQNIEIDIPKTLSVEEAKEMATKTILDSLLKSNGKGDVPNLGPETVDQNKVEKGDNTAKDAMVFDVDSIANELDYIDTKIGKLQNKIASEKNKVPHESLTEAVVENTPVAAAEFQAPQTQRLLSPTKELKDEAQSLVSSLTGDDGDTHNKINKESVEISEVASKNSKKPIFDFAKGVMECSSEIVERVKKVSKTESVLSESIPDIEIYPEDDSKLPFETSDDEDDKTQIEAYNIGNKETKIVIPVDSYVDANMETNFDLLEDSYVDGNIETNIDLRENSYVDGNIETNIILLEDSYVDGNMEANIDLPEDSYVDGNMETNINLLEDSYVDGKMETKIDIPEDSDEDDECDFDPEEYRKRRGSSYEATLANMDPELLQELGIAPSSDEPKEETLDLTKLPSESAEDRLSRIEEKAMKMALEDDSMPRKSRSRSRSRSKSRPPGLDTVEEKSKEEREEAKFYIIPSLDTIKESPSTASMAGMLQTGFSSTSINTVLQGSQSASSINRDIVNKMIEEETEEITETVKQRENKSQDNTKTQTVTNSINILNEDSFTQKTEPTGPQDNKDKQEVNATKSPLLKVKGSADNKDTDVSQPKSDNVSSVKNVPEIARPSSEVEFDSTDKFTKSSNKESISVETKDVDTQEESFNSPTDDVDSFVNNIQSNNDTKKMPLLDSQGKTEVTLNQNRTETRTKESSVDDIPPPLEKVESTHEIPILPQTANKTHDVVKDDEKIKDTVKVQDNVTQKSSEEVSREGSFNIIPGYKQMDEDLPEIDDDSMLLYNAPKRDSKRLSTPSEQREPSNKALSKEAENNKNLIEKQKIEEKEKKEQAEADMKKKVEQERAEVLRRQKEEEEKAAQEMKERAELEKIKQQKHELERKQKEEKERVEKEKKLREAAEKAEKEKEEKLRVEAENKLKEEKTRVEQERKQKEENENAEREKKEKEEKVARLEKERVEAEIKMRKEQERKDEEERVEEEKHAKLENEKRKSAERERKEKEEKERAEHLQREKANHERIEVEKKQREERQNALNAEKERKEKEAREEKEKSEKLESAERERREKASKLEKEREENETIKAEKKIKEETETKQKVVKEDVENEGEASIEVTKPTNKTEKKQMEEQTSEKDAMKSSKNTKEEALPPTGKQTGRKTPQQQNVSGEKGAKSSNIDRFSGSFQDTRRHSQGRGSSSEMSRYSTEHCYSPTYDSSVRSISGESHCRETVERSLQTSQNLMSMVTGSLVPRSPDSQRAKPSANKDAKSKLTVEQKKAQMRQLENQKATPGAVTDIMIKEVGCNWVSLCWKKPCITKGSPIHSYKVEAWLCGEGAFWVELGRTPIPQYDVFNLKPDKSYHFRVTARNKRGWGDSIMTTHKVDLSKPTQMPTITSDIDNVLKTLSGSLVKLNVRIAGEPKPAVKWMRDSVDVESLEGINVYHSEAGSCVEIPAVDKGCVGKYTVTAANTAGKVTKSITLEVLDDPDIHATYLRFKSWQGLARNSLPPYFVAPPRDRRVEEGGSIQLSCKVVGNPWPHVKWYKDDDEVIPDDYTNVYSEGDYQHVQIDEITLDHKGRYCVEAYNEHGVVRSHFTVIVDNGLERYMPPFFTKELADISIRKGCNLLLHCRVESYPSIGVSWHQSGSKIRLRETDYKLVDDDGNVILVIADMQTSQSYNCGIINEIAENSTGCQVEVETGNQMLSVDQDVLRHSLIPRFTSWPHNQVVNEGDTVHISCTLESCNSLFISRYFIPHSVDPDVIQLNKSGNHFTLDIQNIRPDQSGLYFLTARNCHSEEKYPLIIKVKKREDLSNIDSCTPEYKTGAPILFDGGPVFSRDGDTVIIKSTLESGAPPFNISWKFNGQDVCWSSRVAPLNVPGCIGIRMTQVGNHDEGMYTCTVSNSEGTATSTTVLLVDYNEHKESEVMAELCNCPMLDNITPLMSWTNTPAATPRLTTPAATPRRNTPTMRGTPGMLTPTRLTPTPRLTPRATPRATPCATPTPTPTLQRRGYDLRSPSASSSHLSVLEDMMMPPPRRKYIQAPEIFSSFTSQTIEEGGSVEFKCFVSCAPLTTTTWERDGIPMIPGANISLTEKTGVRMLKLHNVKIGDGGTYRMAISNKSGFTNCSACLIVKKRAAYRPKETSSKTSVTSSSSHGYSSRTQGYSSSTHSYYPSRLYSNQSSYNSVRYL